MDSEPNDPVKEKKRLPKIIWLFVAFLPSVVSLTLRIFSNLTQSMKIKIPASFETFLVATILISALACCFVAAVGLLRNTKTGVAQVMLALALAVVFLVMNGVISILAGCVLEARHE